MINLSDMSIYVYVYMNICIYVIIHVARPLLLAARLTNQLGSISHGST